NRAPGNNVPPTQGSPDGFLLEGDCTNPATCEVIVFIATQDGNIAAGAAGAGIANRSPQKTQRPQRAAARNPLPPPTPPPPPAPPTPGHPARHGAPARHGNRNCDVDCDGYGLGISDADRVGNGHPDFDGDANRHRHPDAYADAESGNLLDDPEGRLPDAVRIAK